MYSMRLHEDKSKFTEYTKAASVYFRINPALIEKDYYVTLFLSRAKDEIPGMVFKGGTSLSKCHKVIDRFSEDIDLTLDTEHFTQSPKRTANKTIIRICKDLGLVLTNEEKIWSHREYNCFNVAYPILFPSKSLKTGLKIEMTYIQKCYPDETKRMDSLIGNFCTLRDMMSLRKSTVCRALKSKCRRWKGRWWTRYLPSAIICYVDKRKGSPAISTIYRAC